MVTSQKILSAVRGNWLLNAAGLVLSFCGSVVLVRAIPPGLYAQYAAVLAIVGVATLVFEAGAREAMSCGRPCLVANDDFRETLGRYEKELLFRGGDPTDLAGKLRSLLNRTSAQRNEIGLYLREQVERLHSLPRLATRVLHELQPLRPNRAPAFPQPVTPEEERLC
jgi:glycosyltransferase involved in cell wall biosynthesis